MSSFFSKAIYLIKNTFVVEIKNLIHWVKIGDSKTVFIKVTRFCQIL